MNAEMSFIPKGGNEVPSITGTAVTLDPDHLAQNHVAGLGLLSAEAHPFTMIRSALLDHSRSTGQRIFAVTSIEPGNGKTHIAANLAMVLARVHPTVLIELDLRRPSIGARLGLPQDFPGIDDYLAGECPWSATQARVEGLDLAVHRALRPRNDAETLLASSALPLALRHLHGEAEAPICIVDTPPAILSDDIALIARNVEGVLIVAEEGRTSTRALRDVAKTLAPTPIVGTVLNRSISTPMRRIDYGYYQSTARA